MYFLLLKKADLILLSSHTMQFCIYVIYSQTFSFMKPPYFCHGHVLLCVCAHTCAFLDAYNFEDNVLCWLL